MYSSSISISAFFPLQLPLTTKSAATVFIGALPLSSVVCLPPSASSLPASCETLFLGSAPFPWPNVHRLVRSHDSYASTGAIWCQAERRISAQSIEQVRTSISQVCACSPAFVLGLWHCPLPQFGSAYLSACLSLFSCVLCVNLLLPRGKRHYQAERQL